MPKKFIRRKILSLVSEPGSWITKPFHKHYHGRYKDRHDFPRIVFALDLIILGVIIGLILSLASFLIFGKNTVANQIDFSATVAPTQLTSGAPSTLIINWHNTSEEELRNVKLSLSYPEHFLLEDLSFLDQPIEDNLIEIGSIAPDGTGSLKVHGVMFGDVGGEQTFTSKMNFRYGEKNRKGKKEVEHIFSPVTSALTIDASLPEIIVSEQIVNGTLHLINTGSVDFSEIALTPSESVFDFALTSTNAYKKTIEDADVWVIPGLAKNTSIDLAFVGRAPKQEKQETAEWNFDASFTFDETRYYQSTTIKQFTMIPSPLVIEQVIEDHSITPGGKLAITGTFKNISDETLEDISFFAEGSSPFLAQRDLDSTTYDTSKEYWLSDDDYIRSLQPGEEGDFHIIIPVRASVPRSDVNSYENLTANINSGATFYVPSSNVRASVRSNPLTLSITSPISLNAFARYSTAQGDQIGRGPLPPVVGMETKYWVFWNITGTTNELENVNITATLPDHARASNKQTVSIGKAVRVENNEVSWTIDSLPATFDPQSKTVGIAFEIGIVPSEEHVGKALTILDDIQLIATDSFTGEIIQAYGARIDSNLKNDSMASGLYRVEAF